MKALSTFALGIVFFLTAASIVLAESERRPLKLPIQIENERAQWELPDGRTLVMLKREVDALQTMRHSGIAVHVLTSAPFS